MIPFWFLPYALACGNTVIVKPSERVPLTMQKVFELLDSLKLPAGRREPGERRTRGRRRDPRPSGHPVGQLRRARAPSRGTSTHAGPRPASACSARAARRTRSSSCPTPTCRRPPRSSPTARSAAPASGAWRRRSRSRSATRRSRSPTRSANGRRAASPATGSTRASRWGRSSPPRAARASST